MLLNSLNLVITLILLGEAYATSHLRQSDVGNNVEETQQLSAGGNEYQIDTGLSGTDEVNARDATSAEEQRNCSENKSVDKNQSNRQKQDVDLQKKQQGWLSFNAEDFFHKMDKLDDKFANVRDEYKNAINVVELDRQMLEAMLKSRGAAARAVQKHHGEAGMIPAGLQLGDYEHMKINDSILFFESMKLRNDTHFQIKSLLNDLFDMTLNVDLSLNDLHITATYERAMIGNKTSEIIQMSSYGVVEFLLKNVLYKMEGRYRPVLKDRLTIEHVISQITTKDIIMTFKSNENNEPVTSVTLCPADITSFLSKIRSDLDEWLKDYFNDYLMYFGIVGSSAQQKFMEYDKEKTLVMNKYMDDAIEKIKNKLRRRIGTSIMLPVLNFTVFTERSEMNVELTNGELQGLESIYRRSVTTGRKDGDIRKIDAIVGFSTLKVVYRYSVIVKSKTPPLTGHLILSTNDLTARMGIMLDKYPGVEDLTFDVLSQTKPESLTVEGPGNRIIANMKHLINKEIWSFMTNALNESIKLLELIVRYEDLLTPKVIMKQKYSNNEKGAQKFKISNSGMNLKYSGNVSTYSKTRQ